MTAVTQGRTSAPARGVAYAWDELRQRPVLFTVPLVFFLLIGSWEAAVRYWSIDSFILPGPLAIARELADGIAGGYFAPHTLVTATEMVFGFVIGAGLGLIIGAVVAQFPLIEQTFFAYLVGLQTVPKLAIAPLIVVWFGFGMESKIFISALIVFFPVVINVIEGFQSTDRRQLDMLRAMGATRWQQFRMVKVPNALPYVFVGCNIGVVMSILGAVVGEFVGAQEGLGYLILQYNYQLKIARVFAVLIILAVIGVALHTAVKVVHRRVVFWRKPDHKLDA
jgi:NitT/TauT family transport system permease protein